MTLERFEYSPAAEEGPVTFEALFERGTRTGNISQSVEGLTSRLVLYAANFDLTVVCRTE